MLALDLFCGAGGASLGLHSAGYGVVGLDNWPLAVESHRANGLHAAVADLKGFDWSGWDTPDLLWASPPCQPFSAAGAGMGRWDARDGVPAYLAAVEALRPAVTVMENVRGLTYRRHRPYLDAVVGAVESLGYVAEWRVLNAADFGVPQTRMRLFLVARSDGCPVVWPEPTHAEGGAGGLAPWVTMAEALGWEAGSVEYRLWRGAGLIERHGERPNTPDTRPAPTISTKARSAHWVPTRPTWVYERPARTIGTTYGGVSGRVPAGHVSVEVSEAAALQGFPEGFTFLGSRSAQFKQIGNAVPPQLAQAVAEANLPASCEQAAAA